LKTIHRQLQGLYEARQWLHTFELFFRYEHSKPLKQEEVTATDLSAKPSLAASSNLPSRVGQLAEMNAGEAESRTPNFPTVGAGSEDWVNAIEFVPGQPYCGRSKYSEEQS
jgi:E3 ubiquitin-protein ligase makorin